MLRKSLLIAAVCALALLLTPVHVSSQGGTSLLVTSLDASRFPDIQLAFRVLDTARRVVGGLTREHFSLFENGVAVEDFAVEERSDSPMTVIYVIDLGRYSNYNNFGEEGIRQTLAYLAGSGTFRDGLDTVEIVGRVNNTGAEETVVLLPATQSAAELADAVATMSLARSFGATQALTGIEAALARMRELAQPESSATAIFLLTPVIDTLRSGEALEYAERVAEDAWGQATPVYVFHTHLSGQFAEPLEALSRGSAGQYLLLLPGVDQTDELRSIYERITAQRTSYVATYRTTSGAAGPREVVIALEGSAGQVSGQASYEVFLEPPAVSVVRPRNNETLEIAIEQDVEGARTIDPASLPVVAELGPWADELPRGIVEVEFVVNRQSVERITPSPGLAVYEFSWDVPLIEPGEPTPVTFQVRVRDELGLTAESPPVTLNLSVAEVQTPGFFAACFANPLRLSCMAVFLTPVVFVVALLLAVVVVVIRRQARAQPPPLPAPMPLPVQAAPVFETLIAPREGDAGADAAQALATLRVLEGPADMRGTTIPIRSEMTKIGRNPDITDVTFYPDEQSSVSSQHCTLQLFRGMFFLTDNNSRNGTTVNGRPLDPGIPHTLNDGDRIVLGSLPLKGVELEFSPGGMPDSRTMAAPPLDASQPDSDPTQARSAPHRQSVIERTVLEADDLDEDAGQPPGERQDDGWIDWLG